MGCFVSCLGESSDDDDEILEETEEQEAGPDVRTCLSETQAKVMEDASRRAKEASEAALPVLVKRYQKLGYEQEDVETALRYFREEAPIIIHFDPRQFVQIGWSLRPWTVLDSFLADTHYRSAFEPNVARSNMDGRNNKERSLFQGLYHRGSAPGERPKYGSVNLYNIPQGTAREYGKCYFALRAHVRARCTLTYGNSTMYLGQKIATCAHFAHVLLRFNNEELRCLVERKAYERTSFLVEAQLHGPIEFDRDIAELRFDRSEPPRLQKKLKRWADRNGFEAKTF